MTPDQIKAAARQLVESPLLWVIIDEIEMTAINKCVNAAPVEHEERAAMAAEVRAIRNFRRKLKSHVDGANAGENRAPA